MGRKSILLRSILKRRKTIKIGILGTHSGVGVTHTAIMLCQYLSRNKRYTSVYLEVNKSNEIGYLYGAELGIESIAISQEPFEIRKTIFYNNLTLDELVTLYNQEYEYYILDLGVDHVNNQEEFLRCDIKILVGSLTEWKRHYTFKCINHNRQLPGFEHWIHLMVFGQVKDIKIACSEWGIRAYGIGYEPDPFVLNRNTKELFQKLLSP